MHANAILSQGWSGVAALQADTEQNNVDPGVSDLDEQTLPRGSEGPRRQVAAVHEEVRSSCARSRMSAVSVVN